MVWALVNDVAQRVLTLNKREQRAYLRGLMRATGYDRGARVLDFGCGTGLFARALAGNHSPYVGYDIDERLVRYASRLYPSLLFTHETEKVVRHGPYDYVLANCCFHHIPDAQAAAALGFIARNLDQHGQFVMLDILAPGEGVPAPPLRRLFDLIERGSSLRRHPENVRLLASMFEVVRAEVIRTHLFSIKPSPLYNNLGMYICRPVGR